MQPSGNVIGSYISIHPKGFNIFFITLTSQIICPKTFISNMKFIYFWDYLKYWLFLS